jgi:anti-sigma factor RsiW
MECKEVRKKLKEYASHQIHGENELLEMDKHIENCLVCKRELMLWQDVMSKQRETQQLASYMGGDFKIRAKQRVVKMNSDMSLPPAARRIMSMQKAFTSVTGRLVIQLIALLAGVLYFVMVLKKGANFLSVFFIALGFGTLFFLVLKKKKK